MFVVCTIEAPAVCHPNGAEIVVISIVSVWEVGRGGPCMWLGGLGEAHALIGFLVRWVLKNVPLYAILSASPSIFPFLPFHPSTTLNYKHRIYRSTLYHPLYVVILASLEMECAVEAC